MKKEIHSKHRKRNRSNITIINDNKLFRQKDAGEKGTLALPLHLNQGDPGNQSKYTGYGSEEDYEEGVADLSPTLKL